MASNLTLPTSIDWDRDATVDDLLAHYHDFHPTIISILKLVYPHM
jgi:hypothetical protein